MKMPDVVSRLTPSSVMVPPMRLAELRKRRGWTQVELAERAGCEQPTVSRAEKGSEAVTLRQLRQLADALGVTLADLFLDDRDAAENTLVRAFRGLPPDRRQGWLDLARTLAQSQPAEDK